METEVANELNRELSRLRMTPQLEDIMRAGEAHVRRRRRRRRVLAFAALTVGAVSLAVLGLPTANSSPAYAGWSAEPSAVDPEEASALTAACETFLDTSNADLVANNVDPQITELPPLVGVDVRGHGGVAVFADEFTAVECLAIRSSYDDDWTTTVEGFSIGEPGLARRSVEGVTVVGTLTLGGSDPASLIWGYTAEPVDSAEVLADSGVVIASQHDRVFIGWWPERDATSAGLRLRTSSGPDLMLGQSPTGWTIDVPQS